MLAAPTSRPQVDPIFTDAEFPDLPSVEKMQDAWKKITDWFSAHRSPDDGIRSCLASFTLNGEPLLRRDDVKSGAPFKAIQQLTTAQLDLLADNVPRWVLLRARFRADYPNGYPLDDAPNIPAPTPPKAATPGWDGKTVPYPFSHKEFTQFHAETASVRARVTADRAADRERIGQRNYYWSRPPQPCQTVCHPTEPEPTPEELAEAWLEQHQEETMPAPALAPAHEPARPRLSEALLAVQRACADGGITADRTDEVRRLLAEHGILVSSEIVKCKFEQDAKGRERTRVKVLFSLASRDLVVMEGEILRGEEKEFFWPGIASGASERSIRKAVAGAERGFLAAQFGLSEPPTKPGRTPNPPRGRKPVDAETDPAAEEPNRESPPPDFETSDEATDRADFEDDSPETPDPSPVEDDVDTLEPDGDAATLAPVNVPGMPDPDEEPVEAASEIALPETVPVLRDEFIAALVIISTDLSAENGTHYTAKQLERYTDEQLKSTFNGLSATLAERRRTRIAEWCRLRNQLTLAEGDTPLSNEDLVENFGLNGRPLAWLKDEIGRLKVRLEGVNSKQLKQLQKAS